MRSDSIQRLGDRVVLAAWLGITVLASLLLFASLFVPLSPGVGISVAGMAVSISLLLPETRSEFYFYTQKLTWRWGIISLTLVILAAIFTSQQVTAYDTGLYHFQVIKWLSELGTVPGLTLIYDKFGYHSSWFALAAPFNFGILSAKASTVTGGFAFVLLLLQFALSIDRIVRKHQQFPDWFIFIFGCICLPNLIRLQLPNSPSPDVPVLGLSIVIPWTIILIASSKNAVESDRIFNDRFIPIILAAGAFNIKLNAIVLLLTALFFYSFSRKKNRFQALLASSAIAFLFILPTLIFGLKTSGCPLYPTPLFCWDFLPWSGGAEAAKQSTETIRVYSRWQPLSAPPDANHWNWLIPWMQRQKQATFLLIASFLSLLALKQQQIRSQTYLIVLGILGILLLMYGSPVLRVGLGYLCLLPVLAISAECDRNSRRRALAIVAVAGATNLWLGLSATLIVALVTTSIVFLWFWFGGDRISNRLLIGGLLLLGFAVVIKAEFSVYSYQFYPWLPPSLENSNDNKFIQKQANNIRYFSPEVDATAPLILGQDRCWSATLPCTPGLTHPDIKLRSPERGIAGGFVRN